MFLSDTGTKSEQYESTRRYWEPIFCKKMHYTLKISNKNTQHEKDRGRQTTDSFEKNDDNILTSTMYADIPWKFYICYIYFKVHTNCLFGKLRKQEYILGRS